ncbi:MAG: hypothetical protein EXR29_14960 [Betaproteobacteria bacterium]|nr:hypothetical protein [Betaproteobacteria bacterium]
MIDPSRLLAATAAIYGERETRRLYGDVLPVPQAQVIETPEGATLRLAKRELLFLDTPGHARHHVVVGDEKTGHVSSLAIPSACPTGSWTRTAANIPSRPPALRSLIQLNSTRTPRWGSVTGAPGLSENVY